MCLDHVAEIYGLREIERLQCEDFVRRDGLQYRKNWGLTQRYDMF